MRTALFINPPSGLYRRDDRCQCKVDDQTVRVIFEPIELAIYAAIFERAGWRCAIRDYPARGGTWQDLEADVRALQPGVLLFVPTTATIQSDLQIPALAKAQCAETVVIGKGDYLNIFGERIFAEVPELDAILLGEPDLTLIDIAEGRPIPEIDGVMFRDAAGQPVRRPQRRFLDDLDSLPPPARHLLETHLYTSPESGRPMGVIHAARGCPADCTFCNISRVYGKKIRQHSPERVVEEIETAVRDFGIREFLFHGDTFTYKKNWTINVCKRIVERGLKVRWGCNSRVDTMCPERAAWMKRAGCWVVAFGIESGDQGILDDIKKGATVEQARQAVRITREAGLCVHAFTIIGTPNESRETLAKTYAFLRELNPDFFDFNVAYPLPGTELYATGKSESLFNEEILPHGSYAKAAVRTKFLSNAELSEWRRRALLRMYLRPSYIARTLWRARSPNRIAHYMRAGWSRLLSLRAAP
ncbi:MAG: radical SAM protein [Candidatus Sumerlaeia bacterium]|nr:radical SAM protein [Candidatus Sumerlaeia bacterium]